MKKLYTIISFEPPITCSMDCLGNRETIEISGLEGTLEMPGPPDWSDSPKDPLNIPLAAPHDAVSWKLGNDSIFWGRPTCYPTGMSDIYRVLLTFEVDDELLDDYSEKIRRNLDRWKKLFVDYVELITKQRRYTNIGISKDDGAHYQIFFEADDGKLIRTRNSSVGEIVAIRQDENDALKGQQFKHICRLASRGAPPIEYQLQLDAYRALFNADYRKAIIETAVAAETALTNSIRSKLITSGIGYADQLIEKFRMLGGRLELAKIIQLELPNIDFKSVLVYPRNDVIHRGEYKDASIALSAIKATDALLNKFCPL